MGCESSLFLHMLKSFQGCFPVLDVEGGWNYILLHEISMTGGLLSLGLFS